VEMSVKSEAPTPSEFADPELVVEEEDVSNPIPQAPVDSTREFAHLKRYITVLRTLSPNERDQMEHPTTASVNDIICNLILAEATKTREDVIAGDVACLAVSITVDPALFEADRLAYSAGNSLLGGGVRESWNSLCASWGFDATDAPTGAEFQYAGLDIHPDNWAQRGIKHWSPQKSLPEGVFLVPSYGDDDVMHCYEYSPRNAFFTCVNKSRETTVIDKIKHELKFLVRRGGYLPPNESTDRGRRGVGLAMNSFLQMVACHFVHQAETRLQSRTFVRK
jgi:hypothetical protein